MVTVEELAKMLRIGRNSACQPILRGKTGYLEVQIGKLADMEIGRKIRSKPCGSKRKIWSECGDLNPGPLDPQSSTLPTAPHPDISRLPLQSLGLIRLILLLIYLPFLHFTANIVTQTRITKYKVTRNATSMI